MKDRWGRPASTRSLANRTKVAAVSDIRKSRPTPKAIASCLGLLM